MPGHSWLHSRQWRLLALFHWAALVSCTATTAPEVLLHHEGVVSSSLYALEARVAANKTCTVFDNTGCSNGHDVAHPQPASTAEMCASISTHVFIRLLVLSDY